jgi:hypothetical protein
MSEMPQDIGIQQIHALIEPWRRQARCSMPLFFNSLHNLEEGMVVWNAIGIVVGAIRKAIQSPPRQTPKSLGMPCQLGADRPLILRWEALNQFNDAQRGCAHSENLPPPPNYRKGQAACRLPRLYGASGQDRLARLVWNQRVSVSYSHVVELPKQRAPERIPVPGWSLVTLSTGRL